MLFQRLSARGDPLKLVVLVSETLLPPSRGAALIAFDTCQSAVPFSRACPFAHMPLAANSNAVS